MLDPKLSRKTLSRDESLGTMPKKLAVQLLFVLFFKEELSRGNITTPRKQGVQLLSQVKIKGIRSKLIFFISKFNKHNYLYMLVLSLQMKKMRRWSFTFTLSWSVFSQPDVWVRPWLTSLAPILFLI